MSTEHHASANYEHTDAHIRPIVLFLVWLFIGSSLVLVAMWAMLQGMKKLPQPTTGTERHPLAAERTIPSEPRLEALKGITKDELGQMVPDEAPHYFNTTMSKDWAKRWKSQLSTYGYIDQQIGLVHVPIERAMQLKLKSGFPTATKPKN